MAGRPRRRKRNATSQVPRKRRRRTNPSSDVAAPMANPPLAVDVMQYVLPAAGGYAAGRLASHLACNVVSNKSGLVKGAASIGAPVALSAVAWYLAHRTKFLGQSEPDRNWHSAMVGLAVAALQELVQVVFPTYGILLDSPTRAHAAAPALPAMPANGKAPLPAGSYDPIDELLDNSDLTGGTADDRLAPELEEELRSGIFGG